MKGQIDTFFTSLKEKAKLEEERLKQAKMEKEQKDRIKEKLRSKVTQVGSAVNRVDFPMTELQSHSQYIDSPGP